MADSKKISLLCECESNCMKKVLIPIDLAVLIKERSGLWLLASDCEHGPEPGEKPVITGQGFVVYGDAS